MTWKPARADRKHVFSGSPYEPEVAYCRAIRAGRQIFVSGTAPILADGSNVASQDPYVQATRCLDIAIEAIEALGGAAADVVRTRAYLTDAADWQSVGRAHKERFDDVRPATAFVVVAGLLHEDWRVEIEVEAVVG